MIKQGETREKWGERRVEIRWRKNRQYPVKFTFRLYYDCYWWLLLLVFHTDTYFSFFLHVKARRRNFAFGSLHFHWFVCSRLLFIQPIYIQGIRLLYQWDMNESITHFRIRILRNILRLVKAQKFYQRKIFINTVKVYFLRKIQVRKMHWKNHTFMNISHSFKFYFKMLYISHLHEVCLSRSV